MTREEAERLAALARDAELTGPDAAAWIERLSPEREQFIEAARILAANGEAEAALELAANVWRLWHVSADLTGGRRLLAAALEPNREPSRARALALYADGLLAFRAGAMDESLQQNVAALEAARAVDDGEAEALALVGLSRVAFREGDYARVRSLAGRARELTRDLDPEVGAAPLHMLAAGARLAGDHDEAVELYTESLELARRLGDDRIVGMELHNLGHVELHRGNLAAAERCFSERVAVSNQRDPYQAAMTQLNQAALAFASGQRESAAERLREMASTLDEAGIVLDPDDAFEVDWLRDRLE